MCQAFITKLLDRFLEVYPIDSQVTIPCGAHFYVTPRSKYVQLCYHHQTCEVPLTFQVIKTYMIGKARVVVFKTLNVIFTCNTNPSENLGSDFLHIADDAQINVAFLQQNCYKSCDSTVWMPYLDLRVHDWILCGFSIDKFENLIEQRLTQLIKTMILHDARVLQPCLILDLCHLVCEYI
jgi:hypothetical protein